MKSANVKDNSFCEITLKGVLTDKDDDTVYFDTGNDEYEFPIDAVTNIVVLKNALPDNYFVFYDNKVWSVEHFLDHNDVYMLHNTHIVGRVEKGWFIPCDRVVVEDDDSHEKPLDTNPTNNKGQQ